MPDSFPRAAHAAARELRNYARKSLPGLTSGVSDACAGGYCPILAELDTSWTGLSQLWLRSAQIVFTSARIGQHPPPHASETPEVTLGCDFRVHVSEFRSSRTAACAAGGDLAGVFRALCSGHAPRARHDLFRYSSCSCQRRSRTEVGRIVQLQHLIRPTDTTCALRRSASGPY